MANGVVTNATTSYQVDSSRREIACPVCGAQYSANVHDYFWARAGYAFTCEHDDVRIPCDLVERIYVTGTTFDGRAFGASGWVTVKEACTVDDLTDD